MKKGKRLKHDADALVDSRTGRTKNGEALNRALYYFEAAHCFLMNGYALERDLENGRFLRSLLKVIIYRQVPN